ncbi:MAG: cytochrome b [Planktomarina sp.]
MKRYHPMSVALHWIMAIMILMALFFGKTILSQIPDTDPQKAEALAGHMTIGLILGVLLVVRLTLRLKVQQPPHASTGNAFLDQLGHAAHWVLYLLIGIMVASGLGMAVMGGLFGTVYGGSGGQINLAGLQPRAVHHFVSGLLILLVILHIAAAVYHAVILRDGLFSRMWFGKRQ